MDRASYISSLRHDAAALLAAVETPALDTPVPSCPGWSLERLVGHIGRVYRWTTGWVQSGERPDVERPPQGDAVVSWTQEGLQPLVDALASADLDATVATWAGDQPAVFWPRRMAIETALHRWDAENATGDPAPIDAALAADAIDEAFDVILPRRAGEGLEALDAGGRSLHLHATDTPGEWLVTFVGPPDHVQVERAHAKGDVAARGPVSDLLLYLWNRVELDRLDVFGERDLLARWAETVKI